MQAIRVLLFLILIITLFQAKAQTCLKDIEIDKIEQEKIREYIGLQEEQGICKLEDIQPSMQTNSNLKGYHIRENEYQVNKSMDDVWQYYLSSNPAKLWDGNKISFGFLYSKKQDKIFYCDQEVSKIDTGMVVYINLRLMGGLKNIATAFEFITIDSAKKIIEFSYLSGNESLGKQRIQFYETPKGNTRIIHTSFYKSNNFPKTYFFYPYFHTRITNEFHRNIKRHLK